MTVLMAIGVWVIALVLIWVLYCVTQAREEIRECRQWLTVIDNTLARFASRQPASRPVSFDKTMEH